MRRRDFLGLMLAAAGGIFAPRFGRWYRRGSGLWRWETVQAGAWSDPATWGRFSAPPAARAVVTIRHAVSIPEELSFSRITALGPGQLVIPPYQTTYFHHNYLDMRGADPLAADEPLPFGTNRVDILRMPGGPQGYSWNPGPSPWRSALEQLEVPE